MSLDVIFFFLSAPSWKPLEMTNKATQFKKGFDAKRYVPINQGLVAYHQELSGLLREQSLDVVTFLVNTMNDEKCALKLRMAAGIEVLNRGLGKPVDRTVVATMDAGATNTDPSKLTDDQLLSLVSKSIDKHSIIDGDYQTIENNED